MISLLESFFPVSDAIGEVSTYHDSVKRLENMKTEDGLEWIEEEEKSDPTEISEVSIELKHVNFQYQSERSLLYNFSLKVSQGEKIAILGPSGSGKSTLLKLIQGALVPRSGEILLNGQKANEIPFSIPKMMAVLNQKPYLFNTSVMNNIRLGNPDATDEEVYAAAERVQLFKMIKELPNGFDTNMHETGQPFSGGEVFSGNW